MSDIKWIKIKTDIFSDEKIMYILSKKQGDELVMIWFRMLCLAGRSNSGGCLMMNDNMPYNADMLVSVLNKSKKTVETAINLFQELGMIEIDQNRIYISNWEKHQNVDKMTDLKEYNRLAAQRSRERKKLSECQSKKDDSSTECQPNVNKMSTELSLQDTYIELEEDKEDNKKNYTRRSSDEVSEPAVFEMPLNNKSFHPITQSDINTWQELYPAVDVMQELRKMKGWCDANPRKRKTKKGVRSFINSWLAREQDRGYRQLNSNHTLKNGSQTSNPFIAMMDEMDD